MLKGGNAPQYRSAKNIAREIRYRMLVRQRLGDAFDADPVLEASAISSVLARTDDESDGFDQISDKLFSKIFSGDVSEESLAVNFFDEDELAGATNSEHNMSFQIGPVDFDFSSENELIDSVSFASDGVDSHIAVADRLKAKQQQREEPEDSETKSHGSVAADAPSAKSVLPGVYRRCCKVWVKLALMPFAKNFMWEIDREMYPNYYQLVKNPVSLSSVAFRLSHMEYGNPLDGNVSCAEQGAVMVAQRFYMDVRALCLNCIAYNSEVELLAGQAHKMLHALHTHVVRWVLPPKKVLNNSASLLSKRPEVDSCDEYHCLYTLKPIEMHIRNSSIKCGRCSGTFSPQAMRNHFEGVPQDDLLEETNDIVVVPVGEEVAIDEDGAAVMKAECPSDTAAANTDVENDPMRMYYIPPTDDIISQIAEEWVCMLCLRDDCTGISENFSPSYCNTNHEPAESNFVIDEWGPSSSMPWLLNPSISNYASDSDRVVSGKKVVIDGCCGYGIASPGVRVEAFEDNVKYSLEGRDKAGRKESTVVSSDYPGGLPPQTLILQSAARVLCDNSVSSMLPQTHVYSSVSHNDCRVDGRTRVYEPKTWSISDRLTALRGLCELIRDNPSSHEYLSHLSNDCLKLAKLASPTGNGTSLPVEADFVEQCKAVAGDEALEVFRSVMDGRALCEGDVEGDDIYAQNAVVAGRCLSCKGSTFEDDCRADDTVLLCDGCNVEAHLRCLSLASVPSGEWYCDSCSARIAARDNSDGSVSLDYLEEVNQYRSIDQESGLLHNVVERREEGITDLLHNHKGVPLVSSNGHCILHLFSLTVHNLSLYHRLYVHIVV